MKHEFGVDIYGPKLQAFKPATLIKEYCNPLSSDASNL